MTSLTLFETFKPYVGLYLRKVKWQIKINSRTSYYSIIVWHIFLIFQLDFHRKGLQHDHCVKRHTIATWSSLSNHGREKRIIRCIISLIKKEYLYSFPVCPYWLELNYNSSFSASFLENRASNRYGCFKNTLYPPLLEWEFKFYCRKLLQREPSWPNWALFV